MEYGSHYFQIPEIRMVRKYTSVTDAEKRI